MPLIWRLSDFIVFSLRYCIYRYGYRCIPLSTDQNTVGLNETQPK